MRIDAGCRQVAGCKANSACSKLRVEYAGLPDVCVSNALDVCYAYVSLSVAEQIAWGSLDIIMCSNLTWVMTSLHGLSLAQCAHFSLEK